MARAERLIVLKVPLEDRPGALLKMLEGLKAGKINLTGMWGFSMGQGRAQVFLTARNTEKLEKALSNMGMQLEKGAGFYFKGSNRPGALIKTVAAISSAGINIEATDAISVGDRFGSLIWVKPEDIERTEAALTKK